MAKPVTSLPTWATAATFPASVHPAELPWADPGGTPVLGVYPREAHPQAGLATTWSAQPTKDAAGMGTLAASGIIPGEGVDAEKLNAWLATLSEWVTYVEDAKSSLDQDQHLVETDTGGRATIYAATLGEDGGAVHQGALVIKARPFVGGASTPPLFVDGRATPATNATIEGAALAVNVDESDRVCIAAQNTNATGTAAKLVHSAGAGVCLDVDASGTSSIGLDIDATGTTSIGIKVHSGAGASEAIQATSDDNFAATFQPNATKGAVRILSRTAAPSGLDTGALYYDTNTDSLRVVDEKSGSAQWAGIWAAGEGMNWNADGALAAAATEHQDNVTEVTSFTSLYSQTLSVRDGERFLLLASWKHRGENIASPNTSSQMLYRIKVTQPSATVSYPSHGGSSGWGMRIFNNPNGATPPPWEPVGAQQYFIEADGNGTLTVEIEWHSTEGEAWNFSTTDESLTLIGDLTGFA